MTVRRLTPDDWALYREVRLASLLADPDAFASTHEREVGFGEETWRARLIAGPDGRANACFVDIDGGADAGGGSDAVLGTAGVVYTEHHPAPMLVAMWVRPEARGRGSGRRLVDAVVDWAGERAEPEVVLWVVRDNETAIGLYESCGFEATGQVDALPSHPGSQELEMVKRLAGRAGIPKAQSILNSSKFRI